MCEVGDKIKIVYMEGEPQYTGKEGIISYIGKDCEGDTYYSGSWGGLNVYPKIDKFEKL